MTMTQNDRIRVHDLPEVARLAIKIATADPQHGGETQLVEDHAPACLVGHVLDRLDLLAQLTWENPDFHEDEAFDESDHAGIDELPGAHDHFTPQAYEFLTTLQEQQDEYDGWLSAALQALVERNVPFRVEVLP
jgi:hypothetical protein